MLLLGHARFARKTIQPMWKLASGLVFLCAAAVLALVRALRL